MSVSSCVSVRCPRTCSTRGGCSQSNPNGVTDLHVRSRLPDSGFERGRSFSVVNAHGRTTNRREHTMTLLSGCVTRLSCQIRTDTPHTVTEATPESQRCAERGPAAFRDLRSLPRRDHSTLPACAALLRTGYDDRCSQE